MRPIVTLAAAMWIGLSAMPAANAVEIGEVLANSQRLRLGALVPAEPGDRTARVHASLERLRAELRPAVEVELRVMKGGVQAEVMLGRLLVVGEAVGDLPEPERLALLAHELGHIALGHWQQLNQLYKRHIPGEVRRDTTDPVAALLGRDAHEQSHRHELEADAFGHALAKRLGVALDDALSLLMRQPVVHDTATHPATRRRLAQLRAIEARESEQARLAGDQPKPMVAGAGHHAPAR